jgi:dipeptidyl aminopeptidase/acylaminoacyl peptidase
MVYRGYGRDGPRLFRRKLNDLSVTEVPGTVPVGATYSADGRSLLTTDVGNVISRVSLPSGVKKRVVGDGTGPSERDGVIVFLRGTGLMRMSADRGDPELVPGSDSLRPEFPEVLPGGRWAVFARLPRPGTGNGPGRRDDGDLAGRDIYAIRLSDGATKSLGIRGIEPHYLATGHILVGSWDGVLYAAPFDLSSMTVRGALVPVQEAILLAGRNLTSLPFAVSDNGVLVYARGTSSLKPSIIDQKAQEHPVEFPGRQYAHSRISPSGDRIVAEQIDRPSTDIYVVNRATGQPTRVTHDGISHSPEWTPDGSRVAWLRTERGSTGQPGPTTLVWQRADGSGAAERIPTPDVELHRFVFAPNGKFIVAAFGPATKHDLMLIPLDSSAKPRQLTNTPADEVAPSVSPDNRWIAYASNETGRYEVWIANIEHPETRIQVTTDGANAPVWGADSKTLIVSTPTSFVATTLSFSPRVEVVKRDVLFPSFYYTGANDRAHDFNPKTNEFLVLSGGAQQQNRLVVVTSWFEELKARLAQPSKP